jgi:3,4-dihydroxyphenylacetate 2,3-dioxygenase
MGKLCVAAQITQLPTMIMSGLQGCRKAATDGHRKISQMAKDPDAVIVLDSAWPVNADVNSNTAFKANRSNYEA